MLSIEVISAGAGSGKTYTLTGRMVDLLKSGVRPAGILATTFTKKAAAELQERVRIRLLESGMKSAADELGEAMIGTVHSIGTRLLQRFAFEAGVSPMVEIIADSDEQRLFNESLSQVLTEQRTERMNLLADRLGLTKSKLKQEAHDWRRDIQNLTNVARGNNFTKEVLEISKKRSWESFQALLPTAQSIDLITSNNRLLSALEQCVAALDANEQDGTKTTKDAAEVLRGFQNQLKYRGELHWHEWVKIAKTNVGAKSRDLMEDLKAMALAHNSFQGFHDDIKAYIDLVFDIAIDALGEYEEYKKKRGLIDYTDMETYVSRLLRDENVKQTLSREIDLLLVDEFQDTSPIQLDIFLQLSRLAKHSIWVGDPKQSIYGFRGAEPALMKAVIDASGGIKPDNILKQSWRSRPDLVNAVNAIFTKAFSEVAPEQVVLEPAPNHQKDGEAGLAIRHWHFLSDLDEKKTPGNPWTSEAIADQISVFLNQKPLVFNKKRTETRAAKAGDIAVLCRNNYACAEMAAALHKAGLKASISRAGLLETPEGRLVLACLKYLVLPTDSLSAAEILLLTGTMDVEEMMNDRLRFLYEQRQQEQHGRWANDDAYLRRLHELRPRTADLSASEILSLLLDELDIYRVVAHLGNEEQRLDNLDRLRGYALEYESACHRLHAAASLGGFLLWLKSLGNRGSDMQGAGESDDSVKVLTYHRSKGLEYPITVCHSLGDNLKEQIWSINLVSERETPDLDNILGHRWIRFWVNPYGDLLGKTPLEEALHQTDAWKKAIQTAQEEEIRLLYVGLTRARDYLIFPTTTKPTKWLNRVFNKGDESIPTLDQHSDETPFYHQGMPIRAQTDIYYKPKDFPESGEDDQPVRFFAERQGKNPIPKAAYFIDPYKEFPAGASSQLEMPSAWASWVAYKGDFDPALNKAIRACFLALVTSTNHTASLAIARKQIEIRQLEDSISPAQLVAQLEAFQQFLEQTFKPDTILVKHPLEGFIGKRYLKAEPDLILIKDTALHVLQFAHFAEGMKKWKQQVQNPANYLYWSSALLKDYFPNKIIQKWVIFPIEGQIVKV